MTDQEFEIFFREQFVALSDLAYSVLKDKDEAKDIVQQVFLNFWQKRNELHVKSNPKSYFYRSVLNASITRYKQNRRLTSIEEAPVQHFSDSGEKNTTANINLLLQKAIGELPPVCQKVFRLSRFSDLSNKEIAESMNISVKAVEKHITRALKILRKTMGPYKSHYMKSLIIQLLLMNFLAGVGFCHQQLSS